MRFASVGKTSSKREVDDVSDGAQAFGGEERSRFTLFVVILNDLDVHGMTDQRSKWIATTRREVFVYTGDAEGAQFSRSRLRIWAAVEVDSNGGLLTLLKIADGYRGERSAYADFETEAFERLIGGRL